MSAEDAPVLVAPCKVAIELTCPQCGGIHTVPASIGARLIRDSDGSGTLAIRARAAKVPHLCGQLTLTLDDARAPKEPGGPNDGA